MILKNTKTHKVYEYTFNEFGDFVTVYDAYNQTLHTESKDWAKKALATGLLIEV
jgi:hypothetical protein